MSRGSRPKDIKALLARGGVATQRYRWVGSVDYQDISHNCKDRIMVDLLSGENLSLTTIRKGDKVKFVGNAATNPFSKLQGMCTTAKTALTKAMTSLERASSGFDKLTSDDGHLYGSS